MTGNSVKLTPVHKRILSAIAANERKRGQKGATAQSVLDTLVTGGIAYAITQDPSSADTIGRAAGMPQHEIDALKMGAHLARDNMMRQS